MALNVPGLVVVLVLYVLIVLVGILAARYVRPPSGATATEMSMVAGRNLGVVVGIFTMTATSVGGGYLSGTTEAVATSGILWTVYPFTIILAFTIGSFVFAKPMRERRYLTLLDPLQERYGDVMTGLMLLGALFAELVWGASILIALGTSLSVIIDVQVDYSIIISAAVALLYTCFGAAISVAYTDVVQLCLIAFGMVLCVPFAMTNENAGDFGATRAIWLGSITSKTAASWADYVISQILGGIPWNTYIMRVLAARSVRQAQVVCIVGGLFGWAMAVPPALLGIVGVSADWNATDYGRNPLPKEAASLMPLVIEYFTPRAVSIIALAALVAAVMSSMDSIILSSSSMFTHNIYRLAFRQQAGDREIRIVQLIAMLTVAVICTVVAIFSTTVVGIFVLTADIVYVTLFPQFVCAIFLPSTNVYGSFCAFVVGVVLRFGGGEPSLSIPAFIRYPYFDEETGTQHFPYKTLTMICSFTTLVLVSLLFSWLLRKGILPTWLDLTGRQGNAAAYDVTGGDPSESPASQKGVEVLTMKEGIGKASSASNEAFAVDSTVSLNKF